MEASDITGRAEKVSVVVLAEMYHFHHERVVDFRDMMKFLLHEQIDFYKRVSVLQAGVSEWVCSSEGVGERVKWLLLGVAYSDMCKTTTYQYQR